MAKTPMRGFRIPDDLWAAMQRCAAAREQSVSEWLRDELEALTTGC